MTSKATQKEWVGLGVLSLPCILATMDLTVLNLAAPHLSEVMRPGAAQMLWIMDIYGFMIAGSLITMGTLGDRIGRRKLLLYGAAAFGIASVLAAFSKTPEMLIAARALLGVAGATLAPSTLSLIRNMFHDDAERTVAISIWVTCFSVGAAIGPLLGGILLEHFWWGSVFLLNVPIMILLLIMGPLLLPEFRDPNAGKMDFYSAGLSLVAILSVIYGLKQMAEHGLGILPWLAILTGGFLGFIFIRRQKSLADPLIDPRLFSTPAFNAALSLNLFSCFVAFGAFLFIAQFLQLVLGFSPLKAGLWTMPSSLAFIVGSLITPPLSRRFGPGLVMGVGLLLAAAGFGMLVFVDPTSGLALLVAALSVYSLGISPVFTLATDLIVGSVIPERAGSAASLSETSTELGGALGMAILGSIGTAAYRHHVASAIPSDLSQEVIAAAQATLGGAISVAGNLSGERSFFLLESARDAFTKAFHWVAAIDAVVALGLAGVAIFVVSNFKRNSLTSRPPA